MMINVLDKWEVGGAWCRSGNTKPWPATPMRPRLKLDIPVFAKRINHYSSIISQFSSDTAESSVCNGQPYEGGVVAHRSSFGMRLKNGCERPPRSCELIVRPARFPSLRRRGARANQRFVRKR